jgi:Na+-transporting NADH:ubiquinone oxidoreductase subunit NqrA
MAIQIVMDRTGDSRHRFDRNDAQELAKAEQRFRELTNEGFTAAVRTGPGQVSQIRSFDPLAEETVFFPRLVGG